MPTWVGAVAGLATLRTLAIQVETYRSVPRVLAVSGVDDQCRRIAALLLMPEAFPLLQITPASLRAKHTGRMLQISFQKRYGTSPMAWLWEQRLQAAKTMLDRSHDTGEQAALAAIAAACGFRSVKTLRRCYQARFGEAIGPRPVRRD